MTDEIATAATTAAKRPLWRKVWEFPLTAMVVATVLLLGVLALCGVSLSLLPETLDPNIDVTIRTVVTVAAAIAIYKLVIRRLGRRKQDDLPVAGSLTDTALGFGVGAAIFTTVVGIAAVAGAYRVTGQGGFSDFVQIVMLTGVSAGLIEELLLRGIIFRWLEEFAGSWVALAISSLLFGFGHAANDNATLFSSIAIAIEAGILLGGAYMLTRSLWLAVGIHAGWNVTQGFIWGVPVSGYSFQGLVDARLSGPDWLSGGAFGLEASVIALVVATTAGVWMVWQARKEGKWITPMWSKQAQA
ncbi:CPBP family intramembrane glutamic endopeptidase [Erythrobacter sp. HKB08]|uniref:CPBP family intramembrane glutamic endopeptidase n=1 Tax=Erythrobacter sp. HKB08 TaxID=2502843 RepID=UPI001008EDD9|nr:type II CAAX endopeptidase family protein [Erythrobacter sp. HKB08]